jgi:hypothetical protein
MPHTVSTLPANNPRKNLISWPHPGASTSQALLNQSKKKKKKIQDSYWTSSMIEHKLSICEALDSKVIKNVSAQKHCI